MVAKAYTIPPKSSITIPCLGCFIFSLSNMGSKYSIATTIGYQSDNIRSRISYINTANNTDFDIQYSKEDSEESYRGLYTLTNNNIQYSKVVVIGIRGYSLL